MKHSLTLSANELVDLSLGLRELRNMYHERSLGQSGSYWKAQELSIQKLIERLPGTVTITEKVAKEGREPGPFAAGRICR